MRLLIKKTIQIYFGLMKSAIKVLTAVCILFTTNALADEKYVVMISIDGFGWEWYWQNPEVKIPTLRKLASQGALGSMEATFPSVTWVSHTSIMTGAFPRDHGVIGNSVYNRRLDIKQDFIGDDIFNKDKVVKVDTIYDLLKKNSKGKLTTAAISWPVTRGSKNLDYIVPESYTQSTYRQTTKPDDFLEQLREHGISVDNWGDWSALPESYRQDWLTTNAANYLIKSKKPNLLMLHYLVTDSFSHIYGAGSAESVWAHEYVDHLINSVINTLKQEKIYDKTTILIVSDHGWTNVNKSIKPNVILKDLGLLRVDMEHNIIDKSAIAVMNHGAAFVYILDNEGYAQTKQKIMSAFSNVEGVRATYDGEDFHDLGLPPVKNNQHMPDIVLEAKRKYYFVDDHIGVDPIDSVKYVATHGHDPMEPWMAATLIVAGKNIKKGIMIDDATVRDITPTIMQIFGYEMPDSWPGEGGKYRPGRILEEIFIK